MNDFKKRSYRNTKGQFLQAAKDLFVFNYILSGSLFLQKKDGFSFQLLIVMKKGKARNNPK